MFWFEILLLLSNKEKHHSSQSAHPIFLSVCNKELKTKSIQPMFECDLVKLQHLP